MAVSAGGPLWVATGVARVGVMTLFAGLLAGCPAKDAADAVGTDDTGPSCTDTIQDGDETDVDCGGSCEPCARGLVCAEHADCETGVCVLATCERAVVITGTARPADAVVDEYAESDGLVRIDFAAEPSVWDVDGDAVALPVSTGGSYEEADLTSASDFEELVVGSLRLVNPTGEGFYQTIEPDFFGVAMGFEDAGSAVAGAADLLAAGLDGEVVDIYVIDTTR